jgi:hypothetical protein
MKVIELKKKQTVAEKLRDWADQMEDSDMNDADCCITLWKEKFIMQDGEQVIKREHEYFYTTESIFSMAGALARTVQSIGDRG